MALWVYRGPEWVYGSKEVRSGFMGHRGPEWVYGSTEVRSGFMGLKRSGVALWV